MMNSLTYEFLPLAKHRQALRPAAGYINSAERVEIKPVWTIPAVRYQVYLYETRLVLLPIRVGSDWYQVLE
jgi:hypothetical protein